MPMQEKFERVVAGVREENERIVVHDITNVPRKLSYIFTTMISRERTEKIEMNRESDGK